MRVLVADEFPKAQLEALRGLGLTVDFQPQLKAEDLPVAARDASILIVRGTEVTEKVFAQASALSLVIRAGAGVNTIDVKAASAHGVYVANCPGQNAIAVAELTWGLILAVDRKIPDAVNALREGKWQKKRFSAARGLYGLTLGIIGTAVGLRGRAFGMRVLAHSRSFTARRAGALGFERAESPIAVARGADVLTVHVPASKETKGLISAQVLAALPSGGLFVNTSRADVVDQQALLKEAKSGESGWPPMSSRANRRRERRHFRASSPSCQTSMGHITSARPPSRRRMRLPRRRCGSWIAFSAAAWPPIA